VVRELAEWMRARNAAQPASGDVGIYGLDVYALGTAIDDVTRWLAATDPAAAQEARSRYACFDATQRDPQRYGGASVRPGGSCAADAAAALALVRARATATPDPVEAEVRFRAEGSAHSVVAAEEYFRALYAGVESSWNLRDRRMDAQLAAVQAHVAAVTGGPGKVVVWAHNSHVGDARHTEQGQQGELNLGQLVRQRLGGDASVLVGFFTHGGTVRAAAQWDAPGQVFTVRPALAGSASALLHAAAAGGPSAFVLPLRGSAAAASAAAALDGPRLERAIGVIYMPERERQSHYFTSNLARRFDALVYVDRTTALEPLP
jgi:erythromycin esterase-like protein